ncbi:MAG: BON domain-containing protein [Gammaproteobacteria bacterium]|nr:BON domain-containing protein [Gammaproteobacteria bacterium]
MKKVMLLCALLVTSFIFSSCSPIVQGAAAVTTVATMSNDRRSAGEIIDDKTLNFNLSNIVRKDTILEDMHINFMVYNKAVLMLGEAPSIEARDYLEKQIKQKAPKIRKFINEVSVMPNSSYLSRAKDGIITVQVDALFLDQEVFHPTHVRVITERKTVYLMGSVTKREAEHATNLATKAKNVDKVVKLFNYLLVRPAEEIERDNKRKVEAEKRAELEAKKTELEAAQTALQQQINELSTN